MRRDSVVVNIGGIKIGGQNPIAIQSMTDTRTGEIEKTVKQITSLVDAGSDIVRITVDDLDAARAIPKIKEKLLNLGYNTPLVGCFHYNGHTLLEEVNECAEYLDKYRINPGNVGFGQKKDKQFEKIINIAIKYNKPIRIGVNWGSLDQELLANLMDQNSLLNAPLDANHVLREAIVQSALISAEKARNIGLPSNKIVISAKVSRVLDLIWVYQQLAKRCQYALHLGLTEAGMGLKGTVATSAALGAILTQGIGDTIRASITPEPSAARDYEVKLCKELLQTIEQRAFSPTISSCPGCGRTSSDYFRHLAFDIQQMVDQSIAEWQKTYPGIENLKIAIMGCIVNGPGESKHANIGISLPGNGENPAAPVFIDGEKRYTLRGDDITAQFKKILSEYIIDRYKINNC